MQLLVIFIALIVISVIAAIFLTPKPPKPKDTTQTLEVPVTKIGTIIPVLFGRRKIPNPIIAWYGNVRILKVKVSTSGKK
jgi:hypothetical protein